MKMKFAISASAFVLGAFLAGGAMAQQSSSSSNGASASGGASASNSNTTTNLSIPGLNNNALNSNNDSHDNNSTNADSHDNNSTNTDASNHQDNSTHTAVDSHNVTSTDSHNSTSVNVNARLVLASQDLGANVSNVQFGGSGSNGHDDNRSVSSGAISWSGGAYQGFGGIQTMNVNSGFASAGEAATMVSANSNVTFGH